MVPRYDKHCIDGRTGRQLDVWTMIHQGSCVRVKYRNGEHRRPPPKKRGVIKEFSRNARRRLLSETHAIDWQKVGRSSLITVGYPDDYVHDDKNKRNKERYLFIRYLEKHTGKHLSGYWRVERVPRKSGKRIGEVWPHLHFLIFTIPFVKKELIREWWTKAIGATGYVDVDIREAKTKKKAMTYVSKYIAKASDAVYLGESHISTTMGRSYGPLRKPGIPMHEVRIYPLLDDETIHFTRAQAGAWMSYLSLDYFESFTLLGGVAEKMGAEMWAKEIDYQRRFS